MNKLSYLGLPLAGLFACTLISGCDKADSPPSQAAAPIIKAPPVEPMAIPVCLNDHCGVLDQDGKVLLGFENDFGNIIAADLKGHVLVAKDGLWSLVSADGKSVIKAQFTDGLRTLTPGFFGFDRGGKFGVMNAQGEEVQAPRFDDIYVGGNGAYIIFEVGDKRGVLSATGEPITEALYDSLIVRDDVAEKGLLIPAERNGQTWIIDLKDKSQKQVDYSSVGELHDMHLVVRNDNGNNGLADAHGNRVIAVRYHWLGTPSQGRVAFRENYDSPCGYLDYKGQVVIPAQFSSCLPFGSAGALASARGADGSSGKFGVIASNGGWTVQPHYDYGDSAGLTAMGYTHDVPGYASIGLRDGLLSATYGIYDTNSGKELFAPNYTQIGMLNDDLAVFSDQKAPKVRVAFMGAETEVPTIGLMDRAGKPLVEPKSFTSARLVAEGRFVETLDGIGADANVGLYDLKGQQVLAAQWQKLDIQPTRGVILGYQVSGSGDDAEERLAALYDLQGHTRFTLKLTDCGAEQLVDGAGKPIWPQNPQGYCPETQGQGDTQ